MILTDTLDWLLTIM